ncbi:MAG: nucleoside-diphosphate sugar epimerase/dehydratase [Armatimonadota bacterium]
MIRRSLSKAESVGWRVALAFADEFIVFVSFLVALWMRFDDKPLLQTWNHYVGPRFPGILLSVAFYFLVLVASKMYLQAWRFAGFETIFSLIRASIIAVAGMVLIQYCLYADMMPRSVLFLYWLLSLLGIGTLRLGIRMLGRRFLSSVCNEKKDNTTATVRTIIVGPAEQALAIVKAIAHTSSMRYYSIIGFLDDSDEKQGLFFGGVKVLGTTDLLTKYLENREIDEVIFAQTDDSDPDDIRDLVLECRKRKVLAKVIPNLEDQLLRPRYLRIEDIQMEDLLRRPMRSVDVKSYAGYLTGKRVLITGAGGSIGSEICRQVMRLDPAEVILLGHGENSIFRIAQELRRDYPEMSSNIFTIISSITNQKRISRVFKRFRPQVVFHAAAHKHLPLMEENICEAVHNNVIGTHNVVNACVEYGVEKMVQISTDKAAEPSSIMGATKWICEMVARTAAKQYPDTAFVCVRFGNVLGSRGSVIPVFQEQIRTGGPVTVTHPEMTRFFMAIPEAVRLVIQAGAVGNSGAIYVLDMGKPVRILDLAEDMIRLNGYEPETDIQIAFTGIRPGEKMHETLASNQEQLERTQYDGLNKVQGEVALTYTEAEDIVERFRHLALSLDGEGVLEMLQEVVPGYAKSARAMYSRQVS